MLPPARRGLLLCAWVAVGCAPTVGTECDMAAATSVVYDQFGSPAYVGQSMMITSCAVNGAYCHAAAPQDRYGAPFGMDFDPILADSDVFDGNRDRGEARLLAVRTRIFDLRDDIYAQVVGGQMPPRGIGSARVDDSLAMGGGYHSYTDASDLVGTSVPTVHTAEGHAILRNWLACGAPMIEGVTPVMSVACHQDGDCAITGSCVVSAGVCGTVGATAAARTVDIQPTWDSIYAGVIQHTCATSGCHDASGAPFSGHLDMSSADLAYADLVGVAADRAPCGTRVAPGNPDGSLLVAKIGGTQDHAACGDTMPIGGMLPAPVRTTIQTWITNGALRH